MPVTVYSSMGLLKMSICVSNIMCLCVGAWCVCVRTCVGVGVFMSCRLGVVYNNYSGLSA